MIPQYSLSPSAAIEHNRLRSVVLQSGRLVAWFDGQSLFAADGRAVGFVRGRGLFSLQGDLRGYYQGSAFRDTQGKLVATESRAGAGEAGPPVCVPRPFASVVTDWPPLVPSLDQWSTGWRDVFGTHVAGLAAAAPQSR